MVTGKLNCNGNWGLVDETIESWKVAVEIKLEFQFSK